VRQTARQPARTSQTTLAEALKPVRDRLPRAIVEREILRVVATIPGRPDEDALHVARQEALKWARKRAGGDLPQDAWKGAEFEILSAGRTTMAAYIKTENYILWSLRGDDPDKEVPGRIWSTEVSLGKTSGTEDILLGVRLIVNSTEAELSIEPAVPGLIRQIADSCGLRDGNVPTWPAPHVARKQDDVDVLLEWLVSSGRRLPIVVASGDERSASPDAPLIDVDALGKSLCGLAHIVVLPANLTYRLTDELGKPLSVFHGGVRIYNPGLDPLGDPRDHRLYLASTLSNNSASVAAEIKSGIARESLRRTRLGHDVLSFAAVRSVSLQKRQEQRRETGASETEQLTTALTRGEALEKQVQDLQGQVDQAWQLSEDESSRAEDAEKQLYSAWARIEQLEAALDASGTKAVDENVEPASWEEFAKWCDDRFSSRLSLSSAARRAVRNPEFEDFRLAARCVRWLAIEARDRFLNGGGSLANIPIFDGISNAPCGADEYHFDFQGRRLLANWHVKNGGNTRQPERCLRIYYTFDEITRQVIVSDMPAHRRTGAS